MHESLQVLVWTLSRDRDDINVIVIRAWESKTESTRIRRPPLTSSGHPRYPLGPIITKIHGLPTAILKHFG